MLGSECYRKNEIRLWMVGWREGDCVSEIINASCVNEEPCSFNDLAQPRLFSSTLYLASWVFKAANK